MKPKPKPFIIAKLQDTKTKKSTNVVARLVATFPARYRYEILDIQLEMAKIKLNAESIAITCKEGQVQGNYIFVTASSQHNTNQNK